MRIDLPDGHWAEIRAVEEMKAGDLLAARRAIQVPVSTNGATTVSAGVTDDMRNALLARLITAWSYEGLPVPSLSPASLEELPIAAYRRLCDAVEPHMELVNFTPNQETSSG